MALHSLSISTPRHNELSLPEDEAAENPPKSDRDATSGEKPVKPAPNVRWFPNPVVLVPSSPAAWLPTAGCGAAELSRVVR